MHYLSHPVCKCSVSCTRSLVNFPRNMLEIDVANIFEKRIFFLTLNLGVFLFCFFAQPTKVSKDDIIS